MSSSESLQRKADLLAIGAYPTSKGYIIRLADMNDHHLANAYVKALAEGAPQTITQPLAAEVTRRGIESLAAERALALTGGSQ